MSPASSSVASCAVSFALGATSLWPLLRRTRSTLARTAWAADHDHLTGLPNRLSAHRRYHDDAASGVRHTVVLIDLDDFKTVNDRWGHRIGDALLITVAQRLSAACVPGHLAARLGGDEFLLLLPDTADAEHIVAGLLRAIAEPMTVRVDAARSAVLEAGASAGIALPEPDATWSSQLEHADIALYQAKHRCGAPVTYRAGMQQPANERNRRPARV